MPVQAQHDLGPLSQDEEVSHDLGVLANRSLIVHTYTEHPQPQSCGLVLEHSTKSCTLRLQSQEWTIDGTILFETANLQPQCPDLSHRSGDRWTYL